MALKKPKREMMDAIIIRKEGFCFMAKIKKSRHIKPVLVTGILIETVTAAYESSALFLGARLRSKDVSIPIDYSARDCMDRRSGCNHSLLCPSQSDKRIWRKVPKVFPKESIHCAAQLVAHYTGAKDDDDAHDLKRCHERK